MARAEKSLVIVESPAKARTIAAYLPASFQVEASIGHVRDLPNSAKEIPPKVKGEPWARLGIDVEHDFQPLYIVPAEKKKQVQKLKQALEGATVLYLATDEDREGESISWHLIQVLRPKIPQRRLVFHEITREAIEEALANPRELDERLVKAQEARRILDRLYGYEISPILWRKIRPRLSAGRVQSVAVRLVVDRARQRQRFVRSTFWDLRATFANRAGETFDADLVTLDGQRLVAGRDFDPATGELKPGSEALRLLDESGARGLAEALERADWRVEDVEEKPYTTSPAPPFTTSTLQQEANRKLRFASRRTMQLAQRLYENGHITYMRTDSTTLAESALAGIREAIRSSYGPEYLSRQPRQYQTKVRNAQEAHEAIRPSSVFRLPRELERVLERDELRLYELIWKRTMACQMAEARGHRIAVRVGAAVGNGGGEGTVTDRGAGGGGHAVFQARGKTIEFPGFLRAYAEGSDDPAAELADQEVLLPRVAAREQVEARGLEPRDHTTQPPPRYTEASLIKELETRGIGRPSTYASIIDTILEREYVIRQGNALVPTFTAFAVVNLLQKHFPDLVDFDFTARMEDDLDAISLGTKDSVPYLKEFYFGNHARTGLHELTQQEIDARDSCTIPLEGSADGAPVAVRVGRYGPYLERGDQRAAIPEDLPPDELDLARALELLEQDSGPRELGADPASGKPVFLKTGRFGPYVQLGEGDAGNDKPKMKSLLPGMTPDTLSLEQALLLLSLPREIGADPETGEPVVADHGRYGPYLKRGKDTRSLDLVEDVFSIGLDAALAKLREPKPTRRRGPATLRELGTDPAGNVVRLMEGRYGPYVTDGTTNASLSRGADPADLTMEAALELIEARRAAGPSKRGAKRKAGAAKSRTSGAKGRSSKAAKKPRRGSS
ncbi:MAG TPA: type I DNA topoisomerase [Thermoanaerobaculia bacterium]|nr:type I DNA topoisomerase [Thermoanaerobaculia bacterium]